MAFSKDFLWCGSISAAQAEGGWNEGGKSPVQIDYGDAGSTADMRWIHYRNKDGRQLLSHPESLFLRRQRS